MSAVLPGTAPPPSSLPSTFTERRARLRRVLVDSDQQLETAVFASGWARPRNFAHNVYPFRAESHFLYFVGRQIEGALLVLDRETWTLYLEPSDPEMELWAGPQPTFKDYEEQLELRVCPLSELRLSAFPACLPPQDDETAEWLSELLSRPIEAQSGPSLVEEDATLAEHVITCRLRQDEGGVTQLRAAARISAAAHRLAMQTTRQAETPQQLRGVFEGALISAGLTPGYTSIVTTHGEILHADESPGVLADGDLLLCDVGGETSEGFTADITRTWPVSGRFSSSQRELYEAVLGAQQEAIAAVAPGTHYADLHRGAVRHLAQSLAQLGILRGSLDELCYRGAVSVFFPHGLGHLLGVDVHDMEDLGDRAGYGSGERRSTHPAEAPLRLRRRLESGMCVTIEPGFYQVPQLLARARKDDLIAPLIDWRRLEDFSDVRGIRIEDDVLVTDTGAEVLSKDAPKTVDELERVLAEGA